MQRTIAAVLSYVLFFLGSMTHGAEGKIKKSGPKISVEREVARANAIIHGADPSAALDDPYLASSLYYSAAFIRKIRRRPDPKYLQDAIVIKITNLIRPEFRHAYVAGLEKISAFKKDPGITGVVPPLEEYGEPAISCRPPCHNDALDLFANEGAAVRSISRGIVVLADAGWGPDRQFTTTSRKGGNAVIVFDPETKRFYRYCHLGSLAVKTHDIVNPGQSIGTVGHTGANAARPGHGGHLHLEINRYDEPSHANQPLSRKEIIEELNRILWAATK